MRYETALPLLLLAACSSTPEPEGEGPATAASGRRPAPRGYVCYRTEAPPSIDGKLDEPCWRAAPPTQDFLDIQGEGLPTPRFATRARMLWDDRFFYVAAELEEPHVWATLTRRDSIIFYDNDFEVFIDPDGDTHQYYELEVNALATEWDLLLVKPYRDGGPAVHAWDIPELRTAVAVDGTLNDPTDRDRGWTVEIAIPWEGLKEAAHRAAPPRPGEHWRVNFSRVEWRTHVVDGRYVKDVDPATGEALPEDNWVWSPQGVINMHCPEEWGLVQWSSIVAGQGRESYRPPEDLEARRLLRGVYLEQRRLHAERGAFAEDASELSLEPLVPEGWRWPPEIASTPSLFEAILTHRDGHRLHISQDGRLWRSDG